MDQIIPIKDGLVKFYTKDDLLKDNPRINYKSFLLGWAQGTEYATKIKNNMTIDELEVILIEIKKQGIV